jgi:hypothetical protein
MPLLGGKKARTRAGIAQNIKTELRAGRPRDQSIAIAMRAAGKERQPPSAARRRKGS